jgi:hypothetical protein
LAGIQEANENGSVWETKTVDLIAAPKHIFQTESKTKEVVDG